MSTAKDTKDTKKTMAQTAINTVFELGTAAELAALLARRSVRTYINVLFVVWCRDPEERAAAWQAYGAAKGILTMIGCRMVTRKPKRE